MKITHITYENDQGGASIAVNRINNMLTNSGIKSNVFVFKKKSNIKNHFSFNQLKSFDEKLRFFFPKLIKKILKKIFRINFKYSINFNLLPSSFYKEINRSDSDIINLHWIGNEMISINQISKIKKILIWTLHDMWPYTSVENYIDEQDFLNSYANEESKKNFFCNYIFKKKIKKFKNVKVIICTSLWQKKLCEKSLIFKNAKKILIPLPLNFNEWVTTHKDITKKELGIPKESKVLSFFLSHKYASKRKGIDFVENYLNNTSNKNLFFLTSNCDHIKFKNSNVIHKNFNNITSVQVLSKLYSTSDVVLMPSRLEAFGQTALEAQACNCPVVTFDNTGSQDIIEHLKTGYISKYLDKNDFIKGVDWCLNSNFDDNIIRETVKNKFSEQIILKKYENLIFELKK